MVRENRSSYSLTDDGGIELRNNFTDCLSVKRCDELFCVLNQMVVPTIVCEDNGGFLCIDIIYFNYIIMAKRIDNKKGFKVIKLNPVECQMIGFGIQDEGYFELICDNCNALMREEDCYYVACLNRVLCEECFNEWYDSAERYPEDIHWETHKYNDTVRKLEVNCIIIENEDYGR